MNEILTLKSCRKRALEIMELERQKSEMRAAASSVSGVRYDSDTRGGNKPIAGQQAFVERLERLEEKIDALQRVQCEVWQTLEQELLDLPLLQRQLIVGYYLYGYRWEEVNHFCCVNRRKSTYEVQKALKKLQKNT